MTLTDVHTVLINIHYKPQFILRWEEIDESLIQVWWQFTRQDSRHPWSLQQAESGILLVNIADATEESLVREVWGMTLRLEEHEAREFFTYADQRPFDPHVQLIKPILNGVLNV